MAQHSTPAAEIADLLCVLGRRAHLPALSLRRRHDLDIPELLDPSSGLGAALFGAAGCILAERLAIGGGDRTLGRDSAGGRTFCHPSGPDELGHRGCKIRFGSEAPRPLVSHCTAPLPAASGAIDLRRRYLIKQTPG